VAEDKPDPFELTREMIANAIGTARVCGENRRISNLVAGSVVRFMAEMDDGRTLLAHALACVDADADQVPVLWALLQGASTGRA